MCFLTKTQFIDTDFRSMLGGLCSGLVYTIFPQFQFLVVGIATVLQVGEEKCTNTILLLGEEIYFLARSLYYYKQTGNKK